ncbi:MAG: cation:proton antiporter family protein [Patescibacteria group bacterium]|jgi:Kef-type K+ transport system membrane component KefB
MPQAFVDITLIVIIAAVLGIVARFIKQPTIVAYLITGIIVALAGIHSVATEELLDVMAKFGITLLLFLVGLQLRVDTLRSIGKTALLTGLGQIVVTGFIGFALVRLLGLAALPALYVAIALTFSSTIVVMKMLSEKRDLQSLYGRIVVGFLLVQDIVAIFMLILLSGFQENAEMLNIEAFLLTIAKCVVLFGLVIWLSQKVFPWLFEKLARSHELLFLTSIAWAFGMSLFVSSKFMGLSLEIGAFLAGIALAKSLEQFQIEAELRPLRDFFIVIFFVVLGASLILNDIGSIIVPALILSAFVILLQPVIVLAIMGLLGFKKKTSFFASVTVAQISEFSLILIAMGYTLGHVSSKEVSLVTTVGIITFIVSTYFIKNTHGLYRRVEKYLHVFEKVSASEDFSLPEITKGPIILVGAHRLGGGLLRTIEKQKLVIVEFDPEIVKRLKAEQYKVVFGDITDPDIQNHVHIESAYIVISTVPDLEDNLLLLERIAEMKRRGNRIPKIIVTAYSTWEAKKLYETGADYVLLPHLVGGKHLASLLKTGRLDLAMLNNWRKHDQKALASS